MCTFHWEDGVIVKCLRDSWDFAKIFLADWRGALWPFLLFFSLLFPIGILWILFLMYRGTHVPSHVLSFYVSGSFVTSIVFSSVSYVISRVGWARQQHQLDFWAGLPVKKLSLVVALFAVGVLTAVPGIAGITVAAHYFFHLQIRLGMGAVFALFLGSLAMTAIGSLLGVLAKDGPTTTILNNAISMITMFACPVYYPIDLLPTPLQWLAKILPPTYVASAVRKSIDGGHGVQVSQLLILCGYVVLALMLVQLKLDWRSDTVL